MTTHWVRAVGSICTATAHDATNTIRSQSGLTGGSTTDAVSLTFDDSAAELIDPSLAANAPARTMPPIREAVPTGAAAEGSAAPMERQPSQ